MSTTGLSDPAELLRALGLARPGKVRRRRADADECSWTFESDGGTHLLRIFNESRDRALIHSEVAATRAAGAAGLPVPRILAEGDYQGRAVLVEELGPGVGMVEQLKRRPTTARALGRQMGRIQAKLHRIDAPGVRDLTATERKERMEDAGLVEALEREMEHAAPGLCHFAFHPLNLLTEGGAVSGVLGFGDAARSDPRIDLGMTWAALVAAPLPKGMATRAAGAIRRRLALGWREGYEAEAGDFPLTPLFEAAGLAVYRNELRKAAAAGRGWAQPGDLTRLEQRLAEKKAMAIPG